VTREHSYAKQVISEHPVSSRDARPLLAAKTLVSRANSGEARLKLIEMDPEKPPGVYQYVDYCARLEYHYDEGRDSFNEGG